MLPDENRLRNESDFGRLRKSKLKLVHPLVILVRTSNQLNVSRFAFPASKKVGNAVKRNRGRRLLREAVRAELSTIKPGWDCLFIVRSKTTQGTFSEVHAAVQQLLAKAGLIKDSTL